MIYYKDLKTELLTKGEDNTSSEIKHEQTPVNVAFTRSLFWCVVWVFIFFPIGLTWTAVRIVSNSAVKHGKSTKAAESTAAILIGLMLLCIYYAWFV